LSRPWTLAWDLFCHRVCIYIYIYIYIYIWKSSWSFLKWYRMVTRDNLMSLSINDTSSISLSINDTNMIILWRRVSSVFYIFGWNLNMFPFILWNFWLSNSSFECLWDLFIYLFFRSFALSNVQNYIGLKYNRYTSAIKNK
jgi:hypothetical protein